MTKLLWDVPASRQFETGVDRGVLYLNQTKTFVPDFNVDMSTVVPGTTELVIPISASVWYQLDVGKSIIMVDPSTSTRTITGTIIHKSGSSITVSVSAKTGTGFGLSGWNITQITPAVPWNGITSVDETGSDSAVSYYVDGRPFLYFPKPREYGANIKAYTYPEEFSEILGIVEATDGMFLDSQVGDTFNFSYRTLIGNAIEGTEYAYKIHLVYNASVVISGVTYDSIGSSVNPIEFNFPIQAVPKLVDGYRATAHVIIDTRNIEPDKLEQIEAILYGTDTTPAYLPDPQTIFDILAFGDTIIITDLEDGTWQAEGASSNVYLTEDGMFQIDNVNAVDNGDGTYDISSTP